MLTKREIQLIPKGFHPNSALRQVFGKKHGSPVLEKTKDGKDIYIIGNRRQRRFRLRNPHGELPIHKKETFHNNRFETFHNNRFEAQKQITWIGRIIKFFASLFHRKAA